FCSWNKALERFASHEKSSLHRAAAQSISAALRGENVCSLLSASKVHKMQQARVSLCKIISSLQYLAAQRMPFHGHTDENSNFVQLLRVCAEDVPELKDWLRRTKYKWISHEIINEILTLMSHEVLNKLCSSVRDAIYYALIMDETTDVTLAFGGGGYETPLTNAQTLFIVLKGVLLQFNFDIRNCHGQCYDGASNVSGVLSGLRRVKAEEPRAVYVHCTAHSLNLVVQDVINFLTMISELIICIRNSPKKTCMLLCPFCPTRWCLCVTSLRSVDSNYATLLKFLDEIGNSDITNTGAKAHRFLTQLQKFNTFFTLQLLVSI
uniref:Uncharacterized protein n=1 Tax=Latimeria chalumnae TaxID=7897 RepID=H3AM72_LATCH